MSTENSKLYDTQMIWQEDNKMRDALQEYLKICENCLNQFDKCLDRTSKEKILKPLQLIIKHLSNQNLLLYNGWKKCEEEWLKNANASKRKSEQKDAMQVFENDFLREKVTKMEDDIKSFENLLRKSTCGSDYSADDFAFNFANGEKIQNIVQNRNTPDQTSQENQNDSPTTSSTKEHKFPTETALISSSIKNDSNTGSTNNSISRKNANQYISKLQNGSESEICKCLCGEYQLPNKSTSYLRSDSQCIILKDVKSIKIQSKKRNEEDNASSPCDDYCSCYNAF